MNLELNDSYLTIFAIVFPFTWIYMDISAAHENSDTNKIMETSKVVSNIDC